MEELFYQNPQGIGTQISQRFPFPELCNNYQRNSESEQWELAPLSFGFTNL